MKQHIWIKTLIMSLTISLSILFSGDVFLKDASQMFNERGFYNSNSQLSQSGKSMINNFNGNLTFTKNLYNYEGPHGFNLLVDLNYNSSVSHLSTNLIATDVSKVYYINSPEWIISVNGIAVQVFNFESDVYNYGVVEGSQYTSSGTDISMLVRGYHVSTGINSPNYENISLMAGDGTIMSYRNSYTGMDNCDETADFNPTSKTDATKLVLKCGINPDPAQNRTLFLYRPDGTVVVYREQTPEYNMGIQTNLNEYLKPRYFLPMEIIDRFGNKIMFDWEDSFGALGENAWGHKILSKITTSWGLEIWVNINYSGVQLSDSLKEISLANSMIWDRMEKQLMIGSIRETYTDSYDIIETKIDYYSGDDLNLRILNTACSENISTDDINITTPELIKYRPVLIKSIDFPEGLREEYEYVDINIINNTIEYYACQYPNPNDILSQPDKKSGDFTLFGRDPFSNYMVSEQRVYEWFIDGEENIPFNIITYNYDWTGNDFWSEEEVLRTIMKIYYGDMSGPDGDLLYREKIYTYKKYFLYLKKWNGNNWVNFYPWDDGNWTDRLVSTQIFDSMGNEIMRTETQWDQNYWQKQLETKTIYENGQEFSSQTDFEYIEDPNNFHLLTSKYSSEPLNRSNEVIYNENFRTVDIFADPRVDQFCYLPYLPALEIETDNGVTRKTGYEYILNNDEENGFRGQRIGINYWVDSNETDPSFSETFIYYPESDEFQKGALQKTIDPEGNVVKYYYFQDEQVPEMIILKEDGTEVINSALGSYSTSIMKPYKISKYLDNYETITQYIAWNKYGLPEKIINENGYISEIKYDNKLRVKSITYPGDFADPVQSDDIIIYHEQNVTAHCGEDFSFESNYNGNVIQFHLWGTAGSQIGCEPDDGSFARVGSNTIDCLDAFNNGGTIDLTGNFTANYGQYVEVKTVCYNNRNLPGEINYSNFSGYASATYNVRDAEESWTYSNSIEYVYTDIASESEGTKVRKIINQDGNPDNDIIVEHEYDPFNRKIKTRKYYGTGNEDYYESITEYDLLGRKISESDFQNNITLFEYDDLDRLEKIINPDNTYITHSYTYLPNSSGEMASYPWEFSSWTKKITTVDEEGNTTKTYKDELEQVRLIHSEIDSDNSIITYFNYGHFGNQTAVRDPKGRDTLYEYDDLNRMTSSYNIDVGLISYIYDNNGNVIFKQTPNLFTDSEKWIYYSYDALDRLTETGIIESINNIPQNPPVGGVPMESYYYDDDLGETNLRMGKLAMSVNRENSVNNGIIYDYDERGRIVRKNNIFDLTTGEQFSTITETINGYKLPPAREEYNPTVNKSAQIYIDHDQIIQNCNINIEGSGDCQITNGSFGKIIKINSDGTESLLAIASNCDTDVNSSINVNEGDIIELRIFIHPEDGANITISFEYSKKSVSVSFDPEDSYIVSNEYTSADMLKKLTYPDGFFVNFEYNKLGLLSSIPGYMQKLSSGDGFTYNPNGQVANEFYGFGNTGLNYSYSYNDRLWLRNVDAPFDHNFDMVYKYYDNGNLKAKQRIVASLPIFHENIIRSLPDISSTNLSQKDIKLLLTPELNTNWQDDDIYNLLNTRQELNSLHHDFKLILSDTTANYDKSGLQTVIGSATSSDKVLLDLLPVGPETDHQVRMADYLSKGNIIGDTEEYITLEYGLKNLNDDELYNTLSSDSVFQDAKNHLIRLIGLTKVPLVNSPADSTLNLLTEGSLLNAYIERLNPTVYLTEATYQYDGLSRLIVADYSGHWGINCKESFIYDPMGNRETYFFDDETYANELDETVNYNIDQNSNRLLGINNNTGNSYDDNGNLIVDVSNSHEYGYNWKNKLVTAVNEAMVTTNYYYNNDGHRIEKQTGSDFSDITRYIYDGADVIMEYRSHNGGLTWEPVTIKYIYGNGKKVVKLKGEPQSEVTTFIHSDYLGSVRRMTDENQAVVWSRDYYAFGEERAAGEFSEENTYTYEGKEKDLETDLWYNTARFFNDEGRFTQVDPLWAKYPNISPYVRVANNPLIATDPNGQWINFVVGAIVGGGLDYAIQAGSNLLDGQSMTDALWTNVDLGDVAISAAAGASGAGLATKISTINSVGSKLAANLATDATVSTVSQLAKNGEVSPAMVAVDAIVGSTIGSAASSKAGQVAALSSKGKLLAKQVDTAKRQVKNRSQSRQSKAREAQTKYDNYVNSIASGTGVAASNVVSNSLNPLIEK